ncbi:hypothetical protein BY458DRAFT_430156 [Sporodiniella umbellata]|nr:hypothetical protein BY458DRAFT_430156 [Sporodiniella umbellata]
MVQDYLRTLGAVRERCQEVYEKSKTKGGLKSFDIDESKLPLIVDHVVATTLRRFPNLSEMPPHSRLRHFGSGQIEGLRKEWKDEGVDRTEQARRLIDIVLVSVLVDAGAGLDWKYTTGEGAKVGRSEGLALASFDMFKQGYFSNDPQTPHRVDALGLEQLTVARMTTGFQVSESNPMVGLEGRSNVLQRLASVLEKNESFFPRKDAPPRPGNMIDYLFKISPETIHIQDLWRVVMSLGGMFPARIEINGVPLGDVWPCAALADLGQHENLVPFHKLSQWLTYSLIEAIEVSLGIQVQGVEQMTGLPEYRNGGLLVDYGLLVLKPEEVARGTKQAGELPTFEGSDPAMVEWRALTVVYMDIIHQQVQQKLGQKLSLAQVLEGGTWTAGREIAATKRPENGGPPIVIKVNILL